MAVARGSIGIASASVSASTVTVTNPGYVSGTLLIAQVSWASTATITSPGSGFTLYDNVVTGTGNSKSAVYWKIAGGSEPGTYVWTMSAGSSFAAVAIRDYTGFDAAANPPLSGIVNAVGANSTTLSWPAITRSGVGAIVCTGTLVSSRTPGAAPANYTDQQTTFPWRIFFFDRMDAPDGANATFNRTLDSGSGGHSLLRFLITEDPATVGGDAGAKIPLLLS